MPAEMVSAARLMCVLNGGVPDRVPHFEWNIDPRVRSALCPGCRDHNEFAVRMGHDAILVDPQFERREVAPGRWLSEWGYTIEYGIEVHGVEVEALSPIKTGADLATYQPPDLFVPGRYAPIESAVHEFKGVKAIGVHLNDVFSFPRYLLGMTNLLLAIAADPELVGTLVDMSVDINLKMAKEVAARGVDFVHAGDDYAFNQGPLMSPRHFRELFYPGLCRFVRGCHELGLKVVKHTDGNLWPIIDMIVDSGIDCLDPIDSLAGMDLGEVKAKYGDRIALKGNVDCTRLLSEGSVEEVVVSTKAALRVGMPGGGYICSSSNSIHSGVRPENYRAMMDTIREHGRYPIGSI